jgi:saccharopine dehydrogenase (NADP+, L-glutamate forming)
LRLNGWTDAWGSVFKEIETLSGQRGEARLIEMSDQFWKENSYDEGEPDRVVMCVGLKAEKDDQTIWHKTYVMDAWGDEHGTAMARLVSYPVSFAVEAALAQKLSPGVSAAPDNLELVSDWLSQVSDLAQHLEIVDHME